MDRYGLEASLVHVLCAGLLVGPSQPHGQELNLETSMLLRLFVPGGIPCGSVIRPLASQRASTIPTSVLWLGSKGVNLGDGSFREDCSRSAAVCICLGTSTRY